MSEPTPIEGAPAKANRRQRLVIVLSAVAAVAVMAGVVVLAKAGAGGGRSRSAARLPGTELLSPGQLPVGPRPLEPLEPGCEPSADNPPRIVVDAPAEGLDFGQIKQGARVERDLVVRNEGTGLLCLRKAETGCGCVKATLVEDQRRVPPGGSAVVKVLLDSTGREGTQKKSLTIHSNDPASPAKVIPVKAEISLGLVVGGMRVDFGRAARSRPVTATLRVRSPKTDAPWTVQGVALVPSASTPEPPPLTFEAKEVEDAAWRVLELSITHPGRSTYGIDATPVRITTTHPDRPEIVLPSYLEVVTSVLALPARASLGFVPPGRPFRVRLVPGQEGTTFHVTGARIEPRPGTEFGPGGAPFTITFAEAREGAYRRGEWWAEIQYDGKSRKPGLVEAEAVVSTDAPDAPEIRIPVTATVTAGTNGK